MGSKRKNERDTGPGIVRVHRFDLVGVNRFRRDMEMAVAREQGIIPVHIDSYGGYIYDLLAMMDIVAQVQSYGIVVPTVVEGKAMSCGAALLTCGNDGFRYAAPNSTIMIHDASSGDGGKVHELEVSTEEAKRLNDLMFARMAENCGLEPSYFKDELFMRKHADWYLTPKQAKKHKLVNHVRLPSLDVRIQLAFG